MTEVSTNRRNEVLRAILGGGLGTTAGLASGLGDGWVRAAVGILGAVLGLLIAFAVERLLEQRAEVKVLRMRVVELEAAGAQREQLDRLRDYQLAVAQRTAAVAAIETKVWGGAFNEALRTGHFLPVEALLARIEVEQRAQNLHIPIEPPDGI